MGIALIWLRDDLRLNDQPIADGAQELVEADLTAEGVIKLGAGKKKIILVRPV